MQRMNDDRSTSASLTGCLQIEKATHANDGLYTLIVRNEMGSASKTMEAQLHGGKAPTVPLAAYAVVCGVRPHARRAQT